MKQFFCFLSFLACISVVDFIFFNPRLMESNLLENQSDICFHLRTNGHLVQLVIPEVPDEG